MLNKNETSFHFDARRLAATALASAIAIGCLTGLQAQQAKAEEPAKVEAAPELAPGIAPGVVPGARPGGMEPSQPMGATQHPAFAPTPAITPGENAAVDFSPSAILGSPDWPCVQRKVPTISAAQIWDGPSVEGIENFDPAIRNLTEVLESRRVTSDEADKAIQEYAASIPEAERDKKLTELFASFLSEINTDRGFVMGKVEDFQKRQKARAAELEREGQKLADKGLAATDELLPTETKLSPEQQEYNWNARIFQERQQNLTMACEIPALIEQRAYEISRLIRAHMKS
ncbi:MAG: hypothetical protein WC829_16520 [Hyphomicrobium sp.]|jgi:hypothetical protein